MANSLQPSIFNLQSEVAALAGEGAFSRLTLLLAGHAVDNNPVDWTGAVVRELVGADLSLTAGQVQIHSDGIYAVTFHATYNGAGGTFHMLSVDDDASNCIPAVTQTPLLDVTVGSTYFRPTDDGGLPNFFDCRGNTDAVDKTATLSISVQKVG